MIITETEHCYYGRLEYIYKWWVYCRGVASQGINSNAHITGCPSQSPIPFHMLVAQASLSSRSHHWLPKPVSQAVPHAGCSSQSPIPFHMLVAQASISNRSICWLPKPVSLTVHITGCPSQSLSYKSNHYSRNRVQEWNVPQNMQYGYLTLHE